MKRIATSRASPEGATQTRDAEMLGTVGACFIGFGGGDPAVPAKGWSSKTPAGATPPGPGWLLGFGMVWCVKRIASRRASLEKPQ